MNTFYADSSALVKRYVDETGSELVRRLCDSNQGNIIAMSDVGVVEMAAALASKQQLGHFSKAVRDALVQDVQNDVAAAYWMMPITSAILESAVQLTQIYKLRGYDAVHLACALALRTVLQSQNLPAPIFLSADWELNLAAQAENLRIVNPQNIN